MKKKKINDILTITGIIGGLIGLWGLYNGIQEYHNKNEEKMNLQSNVSAVKG